ncbi:MAG TPA: glycosyltransferase [Microlunatus sp.]
MLMSSTGNEGHFGPLVPLAKAAALAGHDVRVAAPASFSAAVQRTGMTHLPFADAPPELVAPVFARLPTLPFAEADAMVISEIFGRIDAQAAFPAIRAAIDEWRPDVVVREPAELGSLAAAERAGVPHVQVAIGMTEVSRTLAGRLGEPLTELAQLAGLPDDSLADALAEEPLLSLVPEVLDRAGDEAYRAAAVTYRYRDDAPVQPVAGLPEWGDPGLPLVYVTFGSVTGSLPPFAGVFRQALDGLSDLPVRVFMTVGRQVDLTAIGPVPTNARVEAWWPQSAVLAEAGLMLGHGGFGTTLGAITAGVPQVVAPIFTFDQVVNARHVEAADAGRAVSQGPDAVARACQEVAAVLSDPTYRFGARAVAAAIEALPTARDGVAAIQRLAG